MRKWYGMQLGKESYVFAHDGIYKRNSKGEISMAVKKVFVPTQPVSRVLKVPAAKISAVKQVLGRRDLQGINVDIVEKPTMISKNVLDYVYLFYGPKKIGKTKFTSLFGGNEGITYFLMFEKLARHLSIRQSLMADVMNEKTGEIETTAWLLAEAYLETLLKQPGNIRVICADGLLAMYEKAFFQGCKEGGFKHPNDNKDFGKSWDKVKGTFYRFVDRLVQSPFGIMFNCHDIALRDENLDGTAKLQIVPNLPKYADEFVRHKVDNVFYMHYRERSRWLQLRGDQIIYAGCANEENFLTPDGEPIWMIPLGSCAEEGYKNFMNAFNNKQVKTYEDVTKQDLTELTKQKGDTSVRTKSRKKEK